jgi:OST-HTH/LOTUS domain-containing protein
VSLAQRCKRLGRTVVGVGAAHSVGRYWEAACDVFRYYDALPGLPAVTTAEPVTAALASGSAPLLLRAVPLATEKSADGWTTAGALKSLMLRLDPSFDEKLEGHSTFTAYLKAHDDVIETRSADNITDVRLRADPPPKKASRRRPAKTAAAKAAPAKAAARKAGAAKK